MNHGKAVLNCIHYFLIHLLYMYIQCILKYRIHVAINFCTLQIFCIIHAHDEDIKLRTVNF